MYDGGSYLFVDVTRNAEHVLKDTPVDHQTYDMKIGALKENGLLISHIRDPTYEMCMIAVTQNGMALSKCPKKLIDYELCAMAICKDGHALEYALETFPSELLDDNLCRLAVKQNGLLLYMALPKVRYGRYELCDIAVEQNGLALKQCPYDVIDYELCRKALSQNPMALEYCPSKLVNDKVDLILCAINKDHRSIQFVDEAHTYYNMLCKEALRINGDSLCYMKALNLKKVYMGLNNHQNNILNIVSHKNFVDFMKTLDIKDSSEVYEHAVGICSAVIFYVPSDVHLNLKKSLDDITSDWEDHIGVHYGKLTKKRVTIGQHSLSMKRKMFENLLIKWYPKHSYIDKISEQLSGEDVPLKACLNAPRIDCYKHYEDSYHINPTKCINLELPRHIMYDKINTCDCSKGKWFNRRTVVEKDGTTKFYFS
jgi:hypothetical protein